ncbi:hypothetical protein EK21DRAFT_96822 [Setomelanomma holmii]|uniref:Uncharacterized protein n=1 Tax=Setomelanomma holmii TaxID=210430 RepID=A0A9P4HLW4_9PLEO|nr:hypothetical protein EK21DRAFT_96822 [Setomelanomma holmii]
MKFTTLVLSAFACVALSIPLELDTRQSGSGNDLQNRIDPSIPSKSGNVSLPVVLWGNGGCSPEGTSNVALLQQIASYGYLVIASGGPKQSGSTTANRVAPVGIFSSGLLTNYTAASTFAKPILYVLGESGDIAYANTLRALHADTLSWKGNLSVGHGGTLNEANGGKFGKAGLNWLEWIFRNNAQAKAYFTGGYTDDRWQVETHALDKLTPVV